MPTVTKKCTLNARGATATKNKCNQNHKRSTEWEQNQWDPKRDIHHHQQKPPMPGYRVYAKNALTKSIKEPQEQLAVAVTKIITLPASTARGNVTNATKRKLATEVKCGNVTNATKRKLATVRAQKRSPGIATKKHQATKNPTMECKRNQSRNWRAKTLHSTKKWTRIQETERLPTDKPMSVPT